MLDHLCLLKVTWKVGVINMKQYLPALCSATSACQTPLTLYSRVFNHIWLSQTCFNTFLTTILTRKFQLIQQEPAQLSCLCVDGRTWDSPPGSESVNSLGGIVLQHLFFPEWLLLIFQNFNLSRVVNQEAFLELLSPSQGIPFVFFISPLLAL